MIKRYFATKDAQITNARDTSFLRSGTLSNMGLSDSGEIFSLYNVTGFEEDVSKNDKSRLLFQFDVASMQADTDIPASRTKYYLRLFNVKHDESLPRNFTLKIHPLTTQWTEGYGLDIDNYLDLGAVNWISASEGNAWSTAGGDFDANTSVSQLFTLGYEDLEIDMTSIVALWQSSSIPNYGVIVKLQNSEEQDDQNFYKKMFSMRGTEYWFSRPCIEARWNDFIFDDRNNSYSSSILASNDDNTNTIYFYNKIRGQLSNIPSIGQGNVYVSFYSSSTGTGSFVTSATGTWVSTGIYKAQFSAYYEGTLYDRWHNNSPIQHPTQPFYTNSIYMKNFLDDYYTSNEEFILSMPNLKPFYHTNDKVRLDLFTRKRNWQPTVYTSVVAEPEKEYIKKAYYQIKRTVDDKIVIPFATGTIEYTRLSYDKDGNYFNLNMNLFEPDFQYEISYIFDIEDKKTLQKDKFKFRINKEIT
jgi:hypothetical protein